jgi:thiamine-monophosphate kinase
VSDGLLLDASRIAAASGCAITIALNAVPLSDDYLAARPESLNARLAAATAGDDYRLLFTADRAHRAAIEVASSDAVRIGQCVAGHGLTLSHHSEPVALPDQLGWLHD